MTTTTNTTLGDNELARRIDGGRLALRPQPARVRWTFDGLVSRDGHDARCALECSVRAVDDPTERRMLQEVLLDGRAVLTSEHVAAHFERALRAALAKAVEAGPIEQLLADAGRESVLSALKAAAHPIAFASGLELLAPFHVEVESPSFQEQRLREMQRALAERHAADRVEHFQRAADLLKQFQAIRQSAPELSAGEVLQQISPTDRGSALQTLLLASAQQDRATSLWAVSGPYLVRVDARVAPPKTELSPLPPTLGPLRSVHPQMLDGRRVLLVGARSGFMVVRPESSGEPEIYSDPQQVSSQLGFSRVLYWGERHGFIGSHGDAGIVRWRVGEPDAPGFRLGSKQLRASYPSAGATASPRNLQLLGPDRVVFSLGGTLIGMDADENAFAIPTASQAEIVAIVPEDRQIVVAHEDGTVCAIDRTSLEITCKQRTGTRLGGAGALPWLGSSRLLLAPADDGPVQCVGLDDPLVTHYASGHRGLRRLAGSADLVAAVSADRQRLILWNTWDGRQPVAEIYLTGTTRHRIADVNFG